MEFISLNERIASRQDRMSPAEQRVARVFQDNREEVLYASAASLATKARASDATVIRTAKTLGFKGMDELRRTVASELKQNLSIAGRLTQTLREVGDDLQTALNLTLDIHFNSIERLRRDISAESFRRAVESIGKARRVVIFGIGPSSAIANYFALQLRRFGLDAICLTRTGLLFADELCQLRSGDVVVAMAYSRVYRELAVLLEESDRRCLRKILLTDSLSTKLSKRFDLILPVARGRADLLSMHTATLALIEALLVGVAAKSSGAALKSLETLNRLRRKLVGQSMDL